MSGLIAAAEETDPLEGAGLLSSMSDLGGAVFADEPTAREIGATAVGAALDGLGALADPLDALFGAGLGWAFEHLRFLREPLDQLAGQPAAIKAQAGTWHNIALELDRVAGDHARDLGALTGWEGAASDAYRTDALRQIEALRGCAADAEELSGELMRNGALVASVRSIIRDTIAELILEIATYLLGAGATAIMTAGGSVAACLAWATTRATAVAMKIAGMVSRLIDVLGEAGARLAELAARVAELSRKAQRVEQGLTDPVSETAGYLTEFEKQGSKAEREVGEWTPLPTPPVFERRVDTVGGR